MMHIGKVIQGLVEKKGISITAFAEKIGTSRRNVYRIFENPSIDTALLTKIGEVLGENLFLQYIGSLELAQRYPDIYGSVPPKMAKGFLEEIIADPNRELKNPTVESLEALKQLHKSISEYLEKEKVAGKKRKSVNKRKNK